MVDLLPSTGYNAISAYVIGEDDGGYIGCYADRKDDRTMGDRLVDSEMTNEVSPPYTKMPASHWMQGSMIMRLRLSMKLVPPPSTRWAHAMSARPVKTRRGSC